MKEEERQRRLRVIKEKKEEAKKLKKMQTELKHLMNNPDVKRYFELVDELEDKEILTADEITKKEMRKFLNRYSGECSHDVWHYSGGYYVERDRGPESRDTYYRTNDSSRINCYLYRCLDCDYQIEVSWSENERFLREHCVIKTKTDYNKCREIYSELLCTNRVDHAYQKLLKRI